MVVATEVMAQPHCSIVLPHQSGPNSGSFALAYSSLPQRGSFWAKYGAPGSVPDTNALAPPGFGTAAFSCFWRSAAFAAASLSHRCTPENFASALAEVTTLSERSSKIATATRAIAPTATTNIAGATNFWSGGRVASCPRTVTFWPFGPSDSAWTLNGSAIGTPSIRVL